MYNFAPVIADRYKNKFENNQYLPFVLELFDKYRHLLIDDYYPQDDKDLLQYIIDEINQLYPWFLIVLKEDQPIGVVYLRNWHGNEEKYHSCQIQAFMDKKHWGKDTEEACNYLFSYLFDELYLERVQMEIPEFNKLACSFAKKMGFIQEGVIRNATIKDSKPINHIIYGLLRYEYNMRNLTNDLNK